MSGPALIVPIRVEALPVGAPDAAGPWSVLPHANFSALSLPRAPYLGAQVFSPPFGGQPFEPGVHVHWRLPRALLQARQERDAKRITLPCAPDRWLVVRTGAQDTQAWVVESNHVDPEPLHSPTSFPGGYIGRVHALEAWPGETEGGDRLPLNAFGYGIPDFAGCYVNCRNVFGMLDAESAPGPRTYTVIGWYADAKRDPLDADPAAFGELAGADPAPRRTLCVGAVSGVPFDPAGAYLRGQHAPLTPDVAIGNTPAEALAALAARRAGADEVAERLLNAFQLGALDRIGETDGIARLEEQMHAAKFAALDGGIEWEVRGGEADLAALNAAQRRWDSGTAELASLRGRLFADWCRRAALRASDRRPQLDFDALDAFMETQADEIDALAGELVALAAQIQVQADQVAAGLPHGARLESVPASRFYQPNDVVVVLCGDGLPGSAPDAADEPPFVGDEPTRPAPAGYERLAPPEVAQLLEYGAAHARPWKLPWRPVELAWRVSVQLRRELDTSAGLDPQVVLDHFAMPPDGFDLESDSVRYEALADEYTGRVLLAANASIGLERQIATAIEQRRYDGLEGLLGPLQQQPLLAQVLSGFTSALGMLAHQLQLPVEDPQGSPLDAAFVTRVRDAIDAERRFSPLMHNPFAPLRTGRFELTELRLIDEFGRWRDVDVSAIAVAETVPTDPRRRSAVLPPLRLSQPAQLNFRWLDAGGTPILGWVVPNHLDDGLMFYDAEGRALGRLTPTVDAPQWRVAPGAEVPAPAGVIAELVASIDDSAYLRALGATLDAARALIAPAQTAADREVAVLVGSPLAVVQASFDLSLLGLPLIDMGIDALRADIARGDVRRRSDRALAGVRLPVLLGSLTQLGDGLAGFFAAGADGKPDFARFLSQAATAHERIARPPQSTVTVRADPGAGATVVTMLVDPRCEVHAYTGVLPVKTLTIGPDVAARGLAALKYAFQTAPVIVPRGRIGVPLPAAAGTWSWLSATGEPVALEPFVPTAAPELHRIADGWLQLDPS
ncbi:hypothetical protein OM076_21330 [Solirubrobacter ginsenosidimutans]|uniref:Uncharacterized protein n=1 Tax=Solirubrobacter ginsenosidimutans TaxID=490573 RepID=A0A9X3MWZ3_9ACTN|nr:hypothetical protein [Solirubrobacter ginsenosidimutans]MDA0162830.1 hypothetical protein [Solirubrobacter ginsenosidimutans]